MTTLSTNQEASQKEALIMERLCRACGLCCNGVLFHLVRLQAGDLIADLTKLGLKIRRKKGSDQFTQPCPALRDCQCSIYAQRPMRCRRFECQQLQGVLKGNISEEGALTKIQEVQKRVLRIEALMESLGKTDLKRPLTKRYEKVMAESADAIDNELQRRMELEQEMTQLQSILDHDFRLKKEGEQFLDQLCHSDDEREENA